MDSHFCIIEHSHCRLLIFRMKVQYGWTEKKTPMEPFGFLWVASQQVGGFINLSSANCRCLATKQEIQDKVYILLYYINIKGIKL